MDMYSDTLFKKTGRFFYLTFIGGYWSTEIPRLNSSLMGARIPHASVLLFFAGILALTDAGRIVRLPLRLPFYLFMSFVFLNFVLVSSFANQSGIKAGAEFFVCLAIPLIAYLLIAEPTAFFRQQLYAFVINGFSMAAIGLYRLFTGTARWVEVIDHIQYGYGSRNLDAFFMMIGFVGCFLLMSTEHRRFQKLALSIAAIVCFTGVVLSLSRGMLLTALLSFFIISLRSSLRLRLNMLILGFVFFCLAMAGLSHSDIGKRVTDVAIKRFSLLTETNVSKTKEGLSNSVPGRLMLIPLSVEAVKEHPVTGLGPGGFAKFAKNHHIRVNDPHNNFLLIWTELGTFSLLAYAGIAFIPIVLSVKLIRINKQTGQVRTARAFALLAFLITFTACFTNYVSYFGYWLIYALFFLIYPMLEPPRPQAKPSRTDFQARCWLAAEGK